MEDSEATSYPNQCSMTQAQEAASRRRSLKNTGTVGTGTADEFGEHMPYFQRGRAWGHHAFVAHFAMAVRDRTLVEAHFNEVDRLVAPLGDVQSAEDLRDYIAGAIKQFELELGIG